MLTAHLRRKTALAAATIGLFAGGAQAASAATVTVTGDDGNPLALAQGAPAAIRNMSPSVGVAFPSTTGRFNLSIVGPDGVAVGTTINCFSWFAVSRSIDYRGNGPYTISVTNFASNDTSCKTPTSTETYAFTVVGAVALAPPTGTFLLRNPNSYTTNSYSQTVGLNPGASTYELRYAAGGVVGPDGAISGPSDTGYVNQTTGIADLRFKAPGTYTVVARATAYGGAGQFFTPWSPPVTVRAQVPFDLSTLSFPDNRGPRYRVRASLRETAAARGGKVSIAIAKGTKGKYRSLGTAKVSSKGTISKSFTATKTGGYRFRFSYKGNALVRGGKITVKATLRRL